MLSVNIIGVGYIGMPLAALLAESGARVHGVDTNPRVLTNILEGTVGHNEPHLADLVAAAVKSGAFTVGPTPTSADVYVIAVPTPTGEDFEPDVSHVMDACASVAPALAKGSLIVVESTCPVGTTEAIVEMLRGLRPDLRMPSPSGPSDVFVAYCPERVLPGNIVAELRNNDRIVGGMTPDCARRASALYRLFIKGACLETDARTAELCKLVENAYRDVNIAFANEISMVCDRLGVNTWSLIELVNRHPRVNVLKPGPGVGGHCIAVDPWFIVHAAQREARLIRTSREVNMRKTEYVLECIRERARSVGQRRGRAAVVACLGVTYKADVDDIRTSPALDIARALSASDAAVLTVDPHVSRSPALLDRLKDLRFVSLEEALQRADVVALLVDHAEFLALPPDAFEGKELIDTRGVFRGIEAARGAAALKLNA